MKTILVLENKYGFIKEVNYPVIAPYFHFPMVEIETREFHGKPGDKPFEVPVSVFQLENEQRVGNIHIGYYKELW